MRKISAHYILPVSSPPLKHGIVVLDDMGMVHDLIDTGGQLRETGKLEFYNGIITPGFILPCHHPAPQPDEIDPGSFEKLDSWLHLNGVRGVGLLQSAGTHFREKQNSPVRYHTIIELCPSKDDEFQVFQSAVNTITDAWNLHEQACSISCCPGSWVDSNLSRYILEYISTHQSILTLRESPAVPIHDQVRVLNSEWTRLNEDAPGHAPTIPGHLIIIWNRDSLPAKKLSLPVEQITVPGLKTFHFPSSAGLQKNGGNTSFLKSLYKIQEELHNTRQPGARLPEILPLYTTEAAMSIFEEKLLGSIEPGKIPGLNLIGGIEYSPDGGFRLKKDSTLKVL